MVHSEFTLLDTVNSISSNLASAAAADAVILQTPAVAQTPLWIGVVGVVTLLMTGVIGIVQEMRIEARERRHKDV